MSNHTAGVGVRTQRPFLARFFERPAAESAPDAALGTQTMTRTHGEEPDTDPGYVQFSGATQTMTFAREEPDQDESRRAFWETEVI